MFNLPGIQTKINTQALPAFMYVRPNHWVVVKATSKGEAILFGQFLPLSKRAALQILKSQPSTLQHRMIKRSTAVKAGLL